MKAEAVRLKLQANRLQGVETELADANKLLKTARREANELPQLQHALKLAQEAEAAARQASESKDPVQAELHASNPDPNPEPSPQPNPHPHPNPDPSPIPIPIPSRSPNPNAWQAELH